MKARPSERAGVRRAPPSKKAGVWVVMPAAVVSLVVAAMIATGVTSQPQRLSPDNDCPMSGPPAKILVLAIDTTDPLSSAQPRVLESAVQAAIDALPAGGKLAIVEVRAADLTEPAVLFERCVPARGTNVERNRMRDKVVGPVRDHLKTLAAQGEAEVSPIFETTAAIAGDPVLHPAGTQLEIVLPTDGLQNSGLASAYHGGPYPTASQKVLSDTRVVIVPLRNLRDERLQAKAFVDLAAWMADAGASVQYTPPVWLAFTKERRHESS